MAYKLKETNVDGIQSTFIHEAYENEIAYMFLQADKDAGKEVDVIYTIDDYDGEDIELWRQDWMVIPIKETHEHERV